jgi:hypothetical protein
LIPKSLGIMSLKHNVYLEGIIPLENMFSGNESPKTSSQNNEYSKYNIRETTLINIGSKDDPKLCM